MHRVALEPGTVARGEVVKIVVRHSAGLSTGIAGKLLDAHGELSSMCSSSFVWLCVVGW